MNPTRSSSRAFVLAAAILSRALAGCGGGGCTYSEPRTVTATITTVDAPLDHARTVAGEACRYVNYSGTGSTFANFDRFMAVPSCLAAEGLAMGSTFMVTVQDQTSGTCTPSIRMISSDTVDRCINECETGTTTRDAGAVTDANIGGDAAD